jgi:hypothetical protein
VRVLTFCANRGLLGLRMLAGEPGLAGMPAINALFSELSLCVSRACLGKMMHF